MICCGWAHDFLILAFDYTALGNDVRAVIKNGLPRDIYIITELKFWLVLHLSTEQSAVSHQSEKNMASNRSMRMMLAMAILVPLKALQMCCPISLSTTIPCRMALLGLVQ